MGLKRKKIGLQMFFTQYLLIIFGGFILIVLIGLGLLSIALRTGFIQSVADIEAQIQNQKLIISTAESVTPEMIPAGCKYAVFSDQEELLAGDMTKNEAAIAWKMIQNGRSISGGILGTGLAGTCYFPIERQNEICILEYAAIAQFSSTFLKEHFPAPEIVLFWFVLGTFLMAILFLSRLFGKKLGQRLRPLQKVTEKIQNKDLEFEIQKSGIQEIDVALDSLGSMKKELKQSLETQWKNEQTKKMQIAALTHDIKTPLTVIRGNAEMLEDTEQTEEQKELTHYIIKNADQMEQYVQMFGEISKADAGYVLQMEKIITREFLDDLESKINALAAVKQLSVEFKKNNMPEIIELDPLLMGRAIINIASNAVDYSPIQGSIYVSVAMAKNKISFKITDSGKGFSLEDFKNATKQFYQGDVSRSSKAHYGMGLFIADSIARQHGGRLLIENAPATGGGRVTIEI
ncbi:sensor histidine kinase [Acetobacterium tundrae]|uniref:histidine kinase n=1 Tax=Acetobacterium tundrae TaxID=132932 RepID=A0ABR6WP54_9FIRM|nr:HAMP domain-containing sensor histidine kinase [Acetobacterium tundrae]MBC3798230.1 sensor histidine kinase [Acetobacterium tundrae]